MLFEIPNSLYIILGTIDYQERRLGTIEEKLITGGTIGTID